MLLDVLREVNDRKIKLLSLDVFDTLLFRTCIAPWNIFGKMYEKKSELFPPHINKEDWVNIRQSAEKKARNEAFNCYGNCEVILDDIYRNLPDFFINKVELKNLEIQCEKEYCFVNKEIRDLLLKIKDQMGCDVILCSDMYLSSQDISDILCFNGFDNSIIDQIYVSSEYKQSKRNTLLFKTILSDWKIRPEEMYHIGDNQYSDVGVPRYLGIRAHHYDRISGSLYRYPFLYLETQYYRDLCDELRSIRIMASSDYCKKEISIDNKFWFDLGAMIYGPFLTFATEWILDEADKNNINVIRPLMREGAFLTRLLNDAIIFREKKYDVKPIYISRFAVFTGMLEQITEKEIKYIVNTNNMRLSDIFHIFNIDDFLNRYEYYANNTMNELKDIMGDESSLYNEIVSFLELPETISLIRERNQGRAQILYEYFNEMKITSRCITVDLGWRGSIQNAINKILKEKSTNSKILHLLLVSNPVTSENVVDNCDIRGYLGNFGSCEDTFRELSVRIMELAFMTDEGTTVGYERKEKGIYPIIKKIKYSKWQTDVIKYLQDGVKNFQQLYYSMVKMKPHLTQWKGKNEELCKLIGRLHSYPMKIEAQRLGALEYDQNLGVDTFNKIIEDKIIERKRKMSLTDFYSSYCGKEIKWYSGINVLASDQFFYCKNIAFNKRKYTNLSMLYLAERVINEKSDNVVLVTAGEMTKMLLQYLIIAGQLNCVIGIVDNNVILHKTTIAGIEIFPVNYDFDNPFYVFTTTNKDIYESLYLQLDQKKGEQMRYIGYFDIL